MAYATRKEDDKALITIIRKKVKNNHPCAVWLIWKYAPDALNKEYETLDDLKQDYPDLDGLDDATITQWMYRDTVQQAAIYLLKRAEIKRDIDLLNAVYSRAMTKATPNDIKSYLELKKSLFKEDDEKDELLEILNGANVTIDNKDIKDVGAGMF